LLRSLLGTNRLISTAAIFAVLATLAAAFSFFSRVPEVIHKSSEGVFGKDVFVHILGAICLLFVGVRALASGMIDTFYGEQRITAGVGLHDSASRMK